MHEDWPVRGVPIPNEVPQRVVPWESLGDLARDPLRSRVFRHAKRHPNSSSMPYDDKTIKDSERDRWKDKKVNRRDAVGMVAQKRAPAYRPVQQIGTVRSHVLLGGLHHHYVRV